MVLSPPDENARRRALLALIVPAVVLFLAATATVDRHAASWFGLHGPLCPVGYLFGEHACPGCGLTRGTALAVQGRWSEALATQPGGFAIAFLCVGAILLHLDVWRRARTLEFHRRLRRIGRWFLATGLIASWALRASGAVPPT